MMTSEALSEIKKGEISWFNISLILLGGWVFLSTAIRTYATFGENPRIGGYLAGIFGTVSVLSFIALSAAMIIVADYSVKKFTDSGDISGDIS